MNTMACRSVMSLQSVISIRLRAMRKYLKLRDVSMTLRQRIYSRPQEPISPLGSIQCSQQCVVTLNLQSKSKEKDGDLPLINPRFVRVLYRAAGVFIRLGMEHTSKCKYTIQQSQVSVLNIPKILRRKFVYS